MFAICLPHHPFEFKSATAAPPPQPRGERGQGNAERAHLQEPEDVGGLTVDPGVSYDDCEAEDVVARAEEEHRGGPAGAAGEVVVCSSPAGASLLAG